MRSKAVKYFLLIMALYVAPNSLSQEIDMKANSNVIVDFSSPNKPDELVNQTSNTLQLTLEKTKDSVYTLYVANVSKELIQVAKQDHSFFIILEAIDTTGHWSPVEYWRYSDCGNSYLSEDLAPGMRIKCESKAYSGSYATKVRFKLLNTNTVFYSNAIDSSVSLSQFDFSDAKVSLNQWYKICENSTIKKVIFLEPDGLQLLSAEYKLHLKKREILRKKNESTELLKKE